MPPLPSSGPHTHKLQVVPYQATFARLGGDVIDKGLMCSTSGNSTQPCKTIPCFIGRPSIHVSFSRVLPHGQSRPNHHPWLSVTITFQLCSIGSNPFLHGQTVKPSPIGSMYAIYGNIYHQYTPNVSIYIYHTWILWSYGSWQTSWQMTKMTQQWLASPSHGSAPLHHAPAERLRWHVLEVYTWTASELQREKQKQDFKWFYTWEQHKHIYHIYI